MCSDIIWLSDIIEQCTHLINVVWSSVVWVSVVGVPCAMAVWCGAVLCGAAVQPCDVVQCDVVQWVCHVLWQCGAVQCSVMWCSGYAM